MRPDRLPLSPEALIQFTNAGLVKRAVRELAGGYRPELAPIGQLRALVVQGSKVLGLAALDEQADPVFDRELAAKLVEAGAEVGAMTPGQLAGWLAEKLT